MANRHIQRPEALSPIASGSVYPSPPSTPPYKIRKYPHDLALGDQRRVPLHRRGTSDKYERLEDLLREAGYKETRIFTPEADKSMADDNKGKPVDGSSSVRGGVGAVVGFLAGLIPGAARQEDISEADREEIYTNHQGLSRRSLPSSPLASKVSLADNSHPRKFAISPQPSTINLAASDPRSDCSSSSVRSRSKQQQHSVRPQSSFTDRRAPPSAARELLRHMASTPNIPKARLKTSSVSVVTEPGVNDGQPSLPQAWLDNVRRAVLSSGAAGAHTGGPEESSSRSMKTQRKGGNRSAYHDTNQHRGRLGTREPANLLAPAQSHIVRAASPGLVNMVNVVCKSAPGSRSSSVVRRSSKRGVFDIGRLDQELKGKGRERGKNKQRSSHNLQDGVPSLVATTTDDDAWAFDGVNHSKQTYHGDEDEDDEEDDEVDLAQLLVPPKRQRSIRSLRRHLDKHTTLKAERMGGITGLEPWRPEDDADNGLLVRRGRRRQESPDEMDTKDWELPSSKQRRGIPDDWAEG